MIVKIRTRWLAGLLLAVLLILSGCEERSESSTPDTPEPEPIRTATLVAAGDNLIHDVIYVQANRRAGYNGHDFTPAYAAVAPLIQRADVAVLNQETLLAGETIALSGYPQFNSPIAVGEEMLAIGFDVFTHANNHAYDQWEKGIEATMAFWDTHPEATISGIYRTAEEAAQIPLREVNGIQFAFLAFTEQTNGLVLPKDSPYGTYLFDDMEQVEQRVRSAAEQADVVVVSPHWGWEGTTRLSPFQEKVAQQLVEWGADLVIGNHSHVTQKTETLTRSDGTTGFVVYSLGNFISAQASIANLPSALLEVEFRKENGETTITNTNIVPIITHYDYGYSEVQVIPLEDYTAEQAVAHGIRGRYPQWNVDWLHAWYQHVYPEQFGEPASSTINVQPYIPVRAEPDPETEEKLDEEPPLDNPLEEAAPPMEELPEESEE